MAQDALDSGSPGNTRKELAKEDLVTIYKNFVVEEIGDKSRRDYENISRIFLG